MNRDKFIQSQKLLRLCTIHNHTPHIVPVWYLYEDGKFLIGSNTTTQKIKNIRDEKRVAFCIDVGVHAPDIKGVMGQGEARLILEMQTVQGLAKKILGKYFETMTKSALEILKDTDCIIEITPTKYSSWSY